MRPRHLAPKGCGETGQLYRALVAAVLHAFQGVHRIPLVESPSIRVYFTEDINIHRRHSVVVIRSVLANAKKAVALAQSVQRQVFVHVSVWGHEKGEGICSETAVVIRH